ncbi:Dyp-type peroxidase [Nocardia sp. FBN12]|uniref:Dyp-type peroxidase n=1 Tax=Nocardia sp. FBN12 TaxID=3419766 RepID=UPI003CFF2877
MSGLELHDIQGGVLHPLPIPYAGTVDLFRIDDPQAGRAWLRRLIPLLRNALDPTDADADVWLSVSFTVGGLRALGVPSTSIDSFAPEFREGMRARSAILHDTGESAPENWEEPLGSSDIHVALSAMAPDTRRRDELVAREERITADTPGVTLVYRQDSRSSNGREAFGYADNISQPPVEGSGLPNTNPAEKPLAAGEFILGYPTESGRLEPVPQPEELGRNGTYLVLRKLQQRVPQFRRYLHDNTTDAADEELLAAKIMGRWRSGAPLELAPDLDDPVLGADPTRNNAFGYRAEDARGFDCPLGSHIRRMNPRDGQIFGDPRSHRIIRREASYGPPLPEGLVDDGADRGMMFGCIGSSLRRQFEFVQEEWINSGIFIGHNGERDPLLGANAGHGTFTIPERPIRRRLSDIPTFVVTRGGDYFFMPSLTALRWITELAI